MSRRRRSAEEWRKIIGDQRRSGLSGAAFCRRARVQPVTFYAWRRRVRGEHGFVELKIADDAVAGVPRVASPGSPALELRLPRERSVLIPPGFDPTSLQALLEVLEHSACVPANAEALA